VSLLTNCFVRPTEYSYSALHLLIKYYFYHRLLTYLCFEVLEHSLFEHRESSETDRLLRELLKEEKDLNKVNDTIKIVSDYFTKLSGNEEQKQQGTNLIQQTILALNSFNKE